MKKLTSIFLLLLYGFTAIGATIHLHYCENEFISWNLQHNKKDESCGRCGMKTKSDCCKDTYQQVKLEDEHQKTSADQALQLLHSPVLPLSLPTFHIQTKTAFRLFPQYQALYKAAGKRIYILNAVLLI